MKKWMCFLFGIFLFPAIALAAFEKGVHYQEVDAERLKTNASIEQLKNRDNTKKVYLIEFFSYGCHWCHDFEPHLQKWLKKQKKTVAFVRVPVAFHPSWKLLAKAYFIADALNISNKMDPYFFDYVYQHKAGPESESALRQLFIDKGVSPKDFDAVADTAAISDKLKWAESMVQSLQVRMVPTLMVYSEGTGYITNTQTSGSFENMLSGLGALLLEVQSKPKAP